MSKAQENFQSFASDTQELKEVATNAEKEGTLSPERLAEIEKKHESWFSRHREQIKKALIEIGKIAGSIALGALKGSTDGLFHALTPLVEVIAKHIDRRLEKSLEA